MCGRLGQVDRYVQEYLDTRGFKWDLFDFPMTNYVKVKSPTFAIGYSSEGDILPLVGTFGYQPIYSPQKVWINARAEGKEGKASLNTEDDSNYNGPYNIAKNSGFSHGVKYKRCLIPVSYFIEGPKKERLKKPFVIRRKDKKAFALAGIYSIVEDTPRMGVVTTAASDLLREQVSHHRSPFSLTLEEEGKWLQHDVHEDISKMIHIPDTSGFEAIRISDEMLIAGSIDETIERALEEY